MIILGIFGPGPNPSAALLIDGKIISWAEEERFNRIKTAPNSLPIKATEWCLNYAGITLDSVDKIEIIDSKDSSFFYGCCISH